MEFSIKLEELQRILKHLRSFLKPTASTLEGRVVINVTEEGEVKFVGNGENIGVSVTALESTFKEAGTVSVLYGKLQSFIFSFTPLLDERGGVENVRFKLNKNNLGVYLENLQSDGKKSKSSVRLETFNFMPEDYKKDFLGADFILSVGLLKNAIDKILPAIDPNHHTFFIRGGCFRFEGNFGYIAALNGILVSEYSILDSEKKLFSNMDKKVFVLPYTFIRALRSVIANVPGDDIIVAFNLAKGMMKIHLANIIMWGNLLVGRDYPNYREVFSDNFKNELTISKDLFLSNLYPVLGLLNEDDNNRLTIEIKEGTIRFFNDFAESIFDITDKVSKSFVVDVNGKALRDAVGSIQDELLTMSFSDSNNNLLFDSKTFGGQKTLIVCLIRRST